MLPRVISGFAYEKKREESQLAFTSGFTRLPTSASEASAFPRSDLLSSSAGLLRKLMFDSREGRPNPV